MGGAILWIIIKGAVFQPSVLGTNLTDDALSQLMAFFRIQHGFFTTSEIHFPLIKVRMFTEHLALFYKTNTLHSNN